MGNPAPAGFAIANGGNGVCHCVHVKQLMGRVDILEQQGPATTPSAARIPLLPSMRAGAHAMPEPVVKEAFDPLKPLRERPLGMLSSDKCDRQLSTTS